MLLAIKDDVRAWTNKFDDLVVVDGPTGDEIGGEIVGDKRRSHIDSFPADGLVVAAGGSTWFVDDQRDQSSSIVKIVLHLQDEVMGELGFGWPELIIDGKFAGLLSPVDTGDSVVWQGDGEAQFALGELAALRGTRVR